MLAKPKLALVHVARRQLGLDEPSYRAMLREVAGVASARELDPIGFELVMTHVERLGFRSTSKRKPLPARAGMATPAQVQLVRQLWAEVTGDVGTPRQLGRWLEGHFRVSDVRFLTADTGAKAIAGLKAMKAKRQAAAPRPSAA